MQYLLFLLGFLTLFPRLNAQEPYFDYVLSDYHAQIHAIDWHNGRTLAGGSVRDCDRATIWLFDRKGALQWTRPVFDFGYSRVEAVLFDRQGDLLVAGYRAEADDYGAGDDGWRVEQFDSLGESRFLTPLFRRSEDENPFTTAVHLMELPDNRYVVAIGNRLAWLSPQGDSLFSRNYGEHRHVDLHLLNDSTLAMLAETDFSVLDLNGNLLQRYVHAQPLSALHVRHDTAWYAADNRLYFYHPAMNAPVALPLTGLSAVIDLSSDSAGLLLLAQESGEGAIISRRSNDGSEQARLSLDRYQIAPRQLLFTSDGYVLGGNKGSGCLNSACEYNLGFIQRLPAFSLPDTPRVDLAIDRVAVTGYGPPDTIATINHPQLGVIYQISMPIFLEFTFFNGGQDTVRSYVLGSQRLDGFNCAEYRFYREIESTAIAPGVRHTHPDVLHFFYLTGMGNRSLNGQFFVVAPNHHLDWSPHNDTYDLHLISGPEEAAIASLEVDIYPNPATDQVFLEMEGTALLAATLLDVNGRPLQKWSSSPLPLDRRKLPPGLYILHVQTSKGVAISPLVLH